MAELQERFDSLNEKYENTDASAKEGKEELGKLYGQNMGAIKDTHEKYNAEMSRKDELSIASHLFAVLREFDEDGVEQI